jgi:hypothetical protein
MKEGREGGVAQTDPTLEQARSLLVFCRSRFEAAAGKRLYGALMVTSDLKASASWSPCGAEQNAARPKHVQGGSPEPGVSAGWTGTSYPVPLPPRLRFEEPLDRWETLTVDCFQERYDLRWMSALDSEEDIPKAGKSLIVVADVGGVLHFRMFDGDGNAVVDTDKTRLTEQARPIEDLWKQLESLGPPHEPTELEKAWVIQLVTSIVGYTLQENMEQYCKVLITYGDREALGEYRELSELAVRGLLQLMDQLGDSGGARRLREALSEFFGGPGDYQPSDFDNANLWSLAIHSLLDVEDQGREMLMERWTPRPGPAGPGPAVKVSGVAGTTEREMAKELGVLTLVPTSNLFASSAIAIDALLKLIGGAGTDAGAGKAAGTAPRALGSKPVSEMQDDGQAHSSVAPMSPVDIPPDRRTRPMTIHDAARLMGYRPRKKGKQGWKQPAENLSRLMKDGGIKFIKINRQSYIFDINDFPESARGEALPGPVGKTHPNSP